MWCSAEVNKAEESMNIASHILFLFLLVRKYDYDHDATFDVPVHIFSELCTAVFFLDGDKFTTQSVHQRLPSYL